MVEQFGGPKHEEIDWDKEAEGLSNDTERREKQVRDLEARANTDALTGLLNRRSFTARMEQMLGTLNESRRAGEKGERRAAIVMCDIDHFKKVNDTYGHQAGDAVLLRVGQTLKQNVRTSDCVARFGGEEFAVGLVDGSIEQIHDIAEELRRDIEGLDIQWQSKRIPITMSLGVQEIRSIEELDAVIASADSALYEAKRGGRNKVIFAQAA